MRQSGDRNNVGTETRLKARFGFFVVLLAVSCLFLSGFNAAFGQEVKVDYDEQCGCDIFYVDGIETTRDGELYGFRREDGTVIAPNIYRFVGQFSGGYCKVLLDYGQAGLIDSTGRQVVPCRYDEVAFPSEGRVRVSKEGRFGFTDMEGRVVIPLKYDNAGSFSEGLAQVRVDGFCTYVDSLGKELFAPCYEDVQPFSCGYAFVLKHRKWGLIDHTGRLVMPTLFSRVSGFFGDTLFFAGYGSPDEDGEPAPGEHVHKEEVRESMALYDARLKPLTEEVYLWTGGLQEGRIPVERRVSDKNHEGRYGFLDRQGREVIPCLYDEVSIFSLGRAMVRLGDRYGIIDTLGAVILPIEYEDYSPKSVKYVYRDSLALVERGGKFGFVDLAGRLFTPLCFDDAYHFSEGLASVKYNGCWGYIDNRGETYLPFVFDLASPFQWGRAEVYFEGQPRNVDRQGRCVKNCKGIKSWRKPNE